MPAADALPQPLYFPVFEASPFWETAVCSLFAVFGLCLPPPRKGLGTNLVSTEWFGSQVGVRRGFEVFDKIGKPEEILLARKSA